MRQINYKSKGSFNESSLDGQNSILDDCHYHPSATRDKNHNSRYKSRGDFNDSSSVGKNSVLGGNNYYHERANSMSKLKPSSSSASKIYQGHVFKITSRQRLGLQVAASDLFPGSFYISHISNDSQLYASDLEVGMKIVAINDTPCPTDLEKLREMLTVKEIGVITIYARKQIQSRSTKNSFDMINLDSMPEAAGQERDDGSSSYTDVTTRSSAAPMNLIISLDDQSTDSIQKMVDDAEVNNIIRKYKHQQRKKELERENQKRKLELERENQKRKKEFKREHQKRQKELEREYNIQQNQRYNMGVLQPPRESALYHQQKEYAKKKRQKDYGKGRKQQEYERGEKKSVLKKMECQSKDSNVKQNDVKAQVKQCASLERRTKRYRGPEDRLKRVVKRQQEWLRRHQIDETFNNDQIGSSRPVQSDTDSFGWFCGSLFSCGSLE
jgi:hypothetical protein